MVRRVLNVVYREVRNLHQAAYVLALFTFGSQLLALVRDRLLANQFGAGIELDIYYAAFRIPDVLFVIFASTLSVYVLIPFVADRMDGKENQAARAVLSQVYTVFLGIYVVLALSIWILAPYVVPILFTGLSEQADQVVALLRILLLQPLFLGLSSMLGVITQMGHRFVLYAISPLFYNIGIIIGILFLYDWFGIAGLGYGVVLGAFMHMLVQWPLMRRSDLSFGFTKHISPALLRSILKVSMPRALTLTLHQVTLLLAVMVMGLLATGSISVFQFAFNLQSVPLAIIGASYSTAAFPFLADLYARKQHKMFLQYVTTALRHILFWSLPAVVLIIVLRAQIVRVILGSGEFSWTDTRLTAAVLAVLSVSLVAQAINLLLVRTFYAAGRTLVPFLVTLLGTTVAAALMYGLVLADVQDTRIFTAVADALRVGEVARNEVLLVAVGYTVAILVQATVLLFATAHSFALSLRWTPLHLLRAVIASFAGGVAAYTCLQYVALYVNQESFLGIFVQGLLAAICGIVVVGVTYYVLKTPESHEVYRAMRRRFGANNKVVASQDDVL